MIPASASLPERFRLHLTDLLRSVGYRRGDGVLVGFSGGLDSIVLLHLLRFAGGGESFRLLAGHLDHGMRPGSARDLHWAMGVCSAWGVEVHTAVADPPPSDEARARAARYRFLHEVSQSAGARWILTAHHGDDQAETVLFRAVRGAGLPGLSGIASSREDGVLRPLLPFFREELAAYARVCRITWREDPSNLDHGYTRNLIRGRILPALEAAVPGATKSLARLGELARQDEQAWRSILPLLQEQAGVEALSGSGGKGLRGFRLSRAGLRFFDPGVQARVLRALARRLDTPLDGPGTRSAMEFVRGGRSGHRTPLGKGLVLRRDFDALELELETESGPSSLVRSLTIPANGAGEGWSSLGNRPTRWCWGACDPGRSSIPGGMVVARFRGGVLRFPLLVRTWEPGDRIRLGYGSKKIKKLLAEERISARERASVVVVADGEGAIIWIPRLAVASRDSVVEDEECGFFIAMESEENTIG